MYIWERLFHPKGSDKTISSCLGGVGKPSNLVNFYDEQEFGKITATSLSDDKYEWGRVQSEVGKVANLIGSDELSQTHHEIPPGRYTYTPERNIRHRSSSSATSILKLAKDFCLVGSGTLSLLGNRGSRASEDLEEYILSGNPLVVFSSPRIMVDAMTHRNPTLEVLFRTFGKALRHGANLFFFLGKERLALHCRVSENMVVYEERHAEYTIVRNEWRVRSGEMAKSIIHSLDSLQSQEFFTRITDYDQLLAVAKENNGGLISEPEFFLKYHYQDKDQFLPPSDGTWVFEFPENEEDFNPANLAQIKLPASGRSTAPVS